MAHIRTIKRDFFTSVDIVSLSPLARLLYIALWLEADREGRMAWKPATWKLRYLPADDCDIELLCDEIAARRLVVLYGDGLAHIPAFGDHQVINGRERESSYPAPPDTSRPVATPAARDHDAHVGKEKKGKEGKGVVGDEAASSDALFPGVPPDVVRDFMALRARKKAPITTTAMNGIKREAEKAGLTLAEVLAQCCERGWSGFKAEWHAGSHGPAAAAAVVLPRLQP